MQITKPVRVTRQYAQHINAAPQEVFPLLCPVREVDWVNGWVPRLVLSESGVVERGCVFVMPDQPDDSIWVVTAWKPDDFAVDFVKVTPGLTVGQIEIRLHPLEQNHTRADITYTYTAVSTAGKDFVARFTDESYQGFMKEWELELNHYLEHGTMRPA